MTARFATSPVGPSLSVPSDGAGLLLTTLADGLSLARIARSDIAVDTGVSGAEFAFYGDGPLAARIGLTTPAAAQNVALGSGAVTLGWDLASGQVIRGGTVLASGLPVPAKGEIVGIRITVATGAVQLFHGSTQVAAVSVAAAGTWHLGVSLGSTEAGDLICALNAGQWQAISDAAEAGWRSPAASIATVRLSDIDWLSATTDSPANTRWDGLVEAAGIETLAAIDFWAWGGGSSQGSVAQFRVMDPDGALDALALGDAAGVPVEIRMADADGTLASSDAVARFVIDRIEIESDAYKRITLRDAHDDLDLPLNRGVFLPNIPALAWRPQPVVIGAVASVPALLGNSDGSVGYLADSPLAEVSIVLDRGDPMEVDTWSLDPGSQQLLLDSPPAGPVVVDASSIGAAMMPATLEQALRAIFGRIGKAAWSATDAAAIDTATGYAGVGYYAGDSVSVRTALAAILPSYGAGWWQDADGLIRIVRIVDPAGEASTFDLQAEDMGTDLVAVPDLAPNLTRRMAYQPNARPLAPSEIVTDMVDVPAWRRQELMGLWRGMAYASAPMARRYAKADVAAPLVSCFWRAQDAQAEIDRVVALYAVERQFYRWHVPGDQDLQLQPGQVGTITYPRYGLDAGKKVLVRSVQRNPVSGDSVITFWG